MYLQNIKIHEVKNISLKLFDVGKAVVKCLFIVFCHSQINHKLS